MTERELPCEIYRAVFTVDDNAAFLQEIRTIADEFETHIILFDADRLAGRDHVEAALRHARRSWAGGEPIANSLEMEALLYAAGTRQCQVASSFGIHPGENRSYVAVCPPRPASGTGWPALSGSSTMTGRRSIPRSGASCGTLRDHPPRGGCRGRRGAVPRTRSRTGGAPRRLPLT
ncbi:KEOPS complex subunit Cgi121 [Methanoculleus chikugoensis]|uniref:KEOPS complex subunit Cgi121 n=1 Tax=Methanoculleus chikugoensis TaxID=118126 RepID=UPI001FB2E864|nr:KEOPS complex subunit Cgi121 [Methanoculleus chikugoensis]